MGGRQVDIYGRETVTGGPQEDAARPNDAVPAGPEQSTMEWSPARFPL